MPDSPGWKRKESSLWRRIGIALLWLVGISAALLFAALFWGGAFSKETQWGILIGAALLGLNWHLAKRREQEDQRHYELVDRLRRIERALQGDYRD